MLPEGGAYSCYFVHPSDLPSVRGQVHSEVSISVDVCLFSHCGVKFALWG